jgi:ribonuclease HI
MSTKSSEILIYCDGACSGNPGPGGWGAIVGVSQKHITELGGFQPQTTNNQMELRGAIESLRLVEKTPGEIMMCTDSVYVIRGITQWAYGWQKRGWTTAEGKPVSNREYWEELVSVVAKRKKVFPEGKISWNFVRGHIGIKGNERCDEIAVAFSHRETPDLYEGSSSHYSFDFFKLPNLEGLPEMKGAKKGEKKVALSYLSLVGSIVMRHSNWGDCERRVKGQSGAKFKKAMSEDDESQILQTWGLKPDALK